LVPPENLWANISTYIYKGKILQSYSSGYRIVHYFYLDRIYKILRIFLPFLKKGKNLYPSSREFIWLYKQNEEATWTFGNNTIGFFGFLFPLKAGWLFLGFVWKPRKQ